jgi:hypothetical protein
MFKGYNSANIGARVMNLVPYEVADGKEHIFEV